MVKGMEPTEQEHRPVLRIEPADEKGLDLSEYDYVIRDLKRVALLAGLMFVLLVVLSLLLR
jgi:hypothetical protein